MRRIRLRRWHPSFILTLWIGTDLALAWIAYGASYNWKLLIFLVFVPVNALFVVLHYRVDDALRRRHQPRRLQRELIQRPRRRRRSRWLRLFPRR